MTTVGGRAPTGSPQASSGGPRSAAEPKSGLAVLTSLPRDLFLRGKQAVRTSPGKLAGMLVVVVVLSIVTGVVGAMMVQQKSSKLDDIATKREPVATAAHQLYRALADADAMTVSSFLHGGQDPAKLYARYQRDIQRAGSALAVVSSDFTAGEKSSEAARNTAAMLRKLTGNLPVYAGLIERAYANQRQGYPVGSAYLHEAYQLMQDEMLLPASRLFEAEKNRLAAEQDDANSFPWWTAAFVVLLLASLYYVQRYLRMRTNRSFNVGLVVASVAVVLGLLWGASATIIASLHVSTGRGEGSKPAAVLEQTGLNVITGHAVEMLALVNRNPGSNYDDLFQDFRETLVGKRGNGGLFSNATELVAGTPIAGEVASARRDTQHWMKVHDKIVHLDNKGLFDQAVHLAVAQNEGTAGTLFYKVEDELGSAITKARTVFATQNSAARNALIGLEAGILVLAVISVVGSAVGISKRLQEYR